MIDTNIDFIIEGDTIDLVTDFGQTVTEIKSPETYTGQTTVTPSTTQQILQTKNKLVLQDVTVLPAPEPDLRPLSVSENGSYQPDGFDGYSSVTVNNPAQWTTKGIADRSEPNGDIDLEDATKIVESAFQSRTGITGIIGKLVTTVLTAAFAKCTGLEDVHLPRMTNVSQSCFQECTNLSFLYLPSVQGINTYGFSRCTSLETLIFVNCTNLGRYVPVATNGDENLKTIVLGGNSVVRSSAGFFSGSPFASGGSGGDIYIPKAFYDHLGDGTNQDYLSNAEWNTLNGYGTITWHPIEGSEYETYMPGGAKYEEEMALT